MDDRNNWRHAPIYLQNTWMEKFWPDHNLAWYLAVSEVNTALASVHFKNDGVLQPSTYFWRALEIECIENTIGFELGENGQPKTTSKIPIYAPSEKIIAKHHGGMWDLKKNQKNHQNQRCQNYPK